MNDHQPILTDGPKYSFAARWIFLFLSIRIFVACSAPGFPNYPTQSTDQYQHHQEKNGLTVALSVLTDPDEIDRYFGENLIERDMLPVFVVVSNSNPNTIFLVDQKHMKLEQDSPLMSRPGVVDSSLEDAAMGAIVLFAPLALAPVGMLFGVKIISDNAEKSRNLAVKQFLAKTLAAGQQTQGFIFFQIPSDVTENASNLNHWTIQIEALDTKSKQPYKFNFPIVMDTNPN